jgi:hypothetical protein
VSSSGSFRQFAAHSFKLLTSSHLLGHQSGLNAMEQTLKPAHKLRLS